MCVNSDGVCVEERKMERDQRQGEDSEREGDTETQRERKGGMNWGQKGEEREQEVSNVVH